MSSDDTEGPTSVGPGENPFRPNVFYPDTRTADEIARIAPQVSAQSEALAATDCLDATIAVLQPRHAPSARAAVSQDALLTVVRRDDGRPVLVAPGEMLVRDEPIQGGPRDGVRGVARPLLAVEEATPGVPAAGEPGASDAVASLLDFLGYQPAPASRARPGEHVGEHAAPRHLLDTGATGPRQAGRGPGAVRRFRSGLAADHVREHVRIVADQLGRRAGLQYLIPLGHIIKGRAYPVPAQSQHHDPALLALLRGTPSLPVAVIDTGIAAEIRDDGWLTTIGRAEDTVDPLDVFEPLLRTDCGGGHGTSVCGVIERVAPGCDIRVYRAANSDGFCRDVDLAAALIRAADEGAALINVSMGAPTLDDEPPLALEAAIELISRRYPEVLVVASAGNDGTSTPTWPAAFDEVVAVGAIYDTPSGTSPVPAPWSQYGSWVNCSTVGVGIASTFVEALLPPTLGDHDGDGQIDPDIVFGPDAWAAWCGTSFAAPQITGALAVLCRLAPGLPPRVALEQLFENASVLPGYGQVLRILPGTPVI